MKRIARIALFVGLIAIAALAFQTVFASPIAANRPMITNPTQTGEPAPIGIVDVAFILVTVAFFKTQFDLVKWKVLVVVAVVTLLIALGPRLEATLPFLVGWFGDVVGWFKLFMYAAGGYDLFTDAGPKVFARLTA